MAGDLFLKEQPVVVQQNDDGASLTNLSAALVGAAIDMRAAGTANLIQNLRAIAELKCQWATVGSIAAGESWFTGVNAVLPSSSLIPL